MRGECGWLKERRMERMEVKRLRKKVREGEEEEEEEEKEERGKGRDVVNEEMQRNGGGKAVSLRVFMTP